MRLVLTDMAEWVDNQPPNRHRELIEYYSNRAITNFDNIVYGGINSTRVLAGEPDRLGNWITILALEEYRLIWLSYRADKINNKVLGRIMVYVVLSDKGLSKLMREYEVYKYYANKGITNRDAIFSEVIRSSELNRV